MNLFFFSDSWPGAAKWLHFRAIVWLRFCKILFRKDRKIHCLELRYGKKYLADESYLVLDYRFRNALWYSFANGLKTTEKKHLVFNLKNVDFSHQVMTVHGFFRKKQYTIAAVPSWHLDRKDFLPAMHIPVPAPYFSPLRFPSAIPNCSIYPPDIYIPSVQLRFDPVQPLVFADFDTKKYV